MTKSDVYRQIEKFIKRQMGVEVARGYNIPAYKHTTTDK